MRGAHRRRSVVLRPARLLVLLAFVLAPIAVPVSAAAAPPTDNVFPIASAGAGCNSTWQIPSGHSGVDCFSQGYELGAPLVAVAAGTIDVLTMPTTPYSCSGTTGRGGNGFFLVGGGWSYYYGHVDVLMVKDGQAVQKGDVIATLGKSGNAGCASSVPHLHFEIKPVGGVVENPQPHVSSWTRPTSRPFIHPTFTGSINNLGNGVPVGGGDPYSVGFTVGCVTANGYDGHVILRLTKNDVIQPIASHALESCNVTIGFTTPATKVCVDAYGNGAWHSLGCKGVATGTVGATGTTMTGSQGTGTIAGTASVWGFTGQVGVRTLVGTTLGPVGYTTNGAFTAQFTSAPAGSRVCVLAQSYSMWVRIGCRGLASGTLTSVTGGRAVGTVSIPDFSNPVTVRVYVNNQYVTWGYSAAGAGSRSYSVPFTAAAGAQVCTRADSWGHLRLLGCRTV